MREYNFREGGPASEMAIVDTFTKLIFGEDEYSPGEELIIQALRAADLNVSLDNHREMGLYLRALGVREMISLVGRVQKQLVGGAHILLDETRDQLHHRRAH